MPTYTETIKNIHISEQNIKDFADKVELEKEQLKREGYEVETHVIGSTSTYGGGFYSAILRAYIVIGDEKNNETTN